MKKSRSKNRFALRWGSPNGSNLRKAKTSLLNPGFFCSSTSSITPSNSEEHENKTTTWRSIRAAQVHKKLSKGRAATGQHQSLAFFRVCRRISGYRCQWLTEFQQLAWMRSVAWTSKRHNEKMDVQMPIIGCPNWDHLGSEPEHREPEPEPHPLPGLVDESSLLTRP